ncbi:MAG: hypothetical protein D6790_17685, partial [Caldilineae bacterium]
LDRWVERIRQRHPTLGAAWSTPVESEKAEPAPGLQPSSPRHAEALALVQRIMQVELERSANGEKGDLLVTREMVAHGFDTVPSEEFLVKLIKERLRADQAAKKMPEEIIDAMYAAYQPEDFLREAASYKTRQ